MENKLCIYFLWTFLTLEVPAVYVKERKLMINHSTLYNLTNNGSLCGDYLIPLSMGQLNYTKLS